jgi:hypothetical protein
MSYHPDYYTHLLARRLKGDEELNPAERHELDLHMLICLQCNHTYALWLHDREPARAARLLAQVERALTTDRVIPYLDDLAQVLHSRQTMSSFQETLWRYLQRDPEAMAWLRLAQARAAWTVWDRH